jgi:hypothetical protein
MLENEGRPRINAGKNGRKMDASQAKAAKQGEMLLGTKADRE